MRLMFAPSTPEPRALQTTPDFPGELTIERTARPPAKSFNDSKCMRVLAQIWAADPRTPCPPGCGFLKLSDSSGRTSITPTIVFTYVAHGSTEKPRRD